MSNYWPLFSRFSTCGTPEAAFKEVIGNRLSKVMPVEYVYQELEDLPDGYKVPAGRVKPWETGQGF